MGRKQAQMKYSGKTHGWGKAPSRPKMVPVIPKPRVRIITGGDSDDVSSSSGDEEA
jgi:hypothetical protein